MTRGTRLAMACLLLGASPLASCADAAVSAQDAIALRVVAALHAQHLPPATLATVDRVFGIERRIGAYRAATTRQALLYRINADLRVAAGDARLRLREHGAAQPPDIRYRDLGDGLQLGFPAAWE